MYEIICRLHLPYTLCSDRYINYTYTDRHIDTYTEKQTRADTTRTCSCIPIIPSPHLGAGYTADSEICGEHELLPVLTSHLQI